MKNLKTISLLLISLFIFNLSCSKDDEPIKEQETGEGIDFKKETINIVLPAGSTLDLTKYKVRSVVNDFDIKSNGSSTANFLEGNTNIAYLLDENENPILAGFINKDKREISVRTTVEVSLYYNLGTIFLPAEIREIYINNISENINIDDAVTISETIFKSNSNLISSANFLTEIKSLSKKFSESSASFSTQSKIRITPNDEKSGIRLLEESGNNILFRNTERRRAHAFFYKTKTKSETGVETILIDNIAGKNAVTSKQVSIPATASVTSVIGLLQTVVSGKGLEIGAINSEPTVLVVEGNNNVEETYQARVIGPGKLAKGGLTDAEDDKLLELNIETFALDILIPIISTAIGNEKVFKASDPGVQDFIGEVTNVIGSVIGANDAAKTGDFSQLTYAFLEGMADSVTSSTFEPMVKSGTKLILDVMLDSNGRSLTTEAKNVKLAKVNKLFAALKIADFVLQGVDLVRVMGSIITSESLENFELTISKAKVSLEPFSAKLKTGDQDITYTAEVNGQTLAAGQSFEYVWTSTGDEGVLVAINKNEIHPTTLTTSLNQIKYRAQGSNGRDEIKVEVFLKEAGKDKIRIDDEVAWVEVIDFEMKITPNNQTISGGTSIDLSVVDDKGKDFTKDELSEYSFVWKTNGQFGKYNGTRNTVSQDVNKIRYEALERTQEGTENVSVSVYRKAKGSNDGFKFLQTVEGTINISNDPKKKYISLPLTYTVTKIADEECIVSSIPLVAEASIRNLLDVSFYISKIPNAKSYSLLMTDIFDGDGKPYANLTRSWNQGQTTYANTHQFTNPEVADFDFRFSIGSVSSNICNPSYSDSVRFIGGARATGQLIVTLE